MTVSPKRDNEKRYDCQELEFTSDLKNIGVRGLNQEINKDYSSSVTLRYRPEVNRHNTHIYRLLGFTKLFTNYNI